MLGHWLHDPNVLFAGGIVLVVVAWRIVKTITSGPSV
jgi:hypothetical protein